MTGEDWDTEHRDSDRGQTVTYLMTAGALILIAFAYAVFQSPVSRLETESYRISQTEQSETGTEWVHHYWEWLPLAVVLLLMVMLIAAAIHQSRRP